MIGAQLAHFRITAKLGEGGMGAVYRAEDTRLGREVAIKVLPDALVDDPDRLARFEREARVLASLDHPNIAGIHEVGHAVPESDARSPEADPGSDDGDPKRPSSASAGQPIHFLVMQLASGETLEDRLARAAVPVDEAIRIALQIAEALEAAHEKGIVHRDLKPANVKVDAEGHVMVLDFGLAKALEGDPTDASSPDLTRSPTLTGHATMGGVLLGTAAYMSPEQAKGVPVDKRSDIWAFGVALWEMLSGERLFAGDTVSETLAAVLRDPVDVRTLPKDVPPFLRHLVGRCLERDPRLRLRDMGEARIALAVGPPEPSTKDGGGRETPSTSPWARWLPALLGAGALAAAIGLVVPPDRGRRASEDELRRFSVVVPGLHIVRDDNYSTVAVSPDGETLVTRGFGLTDDMFFVRRLADREATRVDASAGAFEAFFSPDGRWLGFNRGRALYKIELGGAGALPISDVPHNAMGVSWGSDAFVYFGTLAGDLWRVAESGGGEPERIAAPDGGSGELRLRRPTVLPGGRGVVFHVEKSDGRVPTLAVLDLATGERKDLGIFGVSPVYASSGHLIFGQGESSALAVPFDARALEVTGPARILLDDVSIHDNTMQLAVSQRGTLVYMSIESASAVIPVLVDRSGAATSLVQDASELPDCSDPRFSPDGDRVVFSVGRGVSILDVRSGTVSHLTDDGFYPAWSPDGAWIVHSNNIAESYDLIRRSADLRPGEEVLLDRANNLRSADWTRHAFIFREEIPGKGMDLRYLPPDLEGEPVPLLEDAADELAPALSPDGRWLAFQSDRSGRDEVFVTSFPVPRGRLQVSTRGGRAPAWSPAGDELYYFEGDTLVAARLGFEPGLQVAERHDLFSGAYHQYRWYRQYDVHPDGDRFLMIEIVGGKGTVEVVLGWPRMLEGVAP